MMDYHISKKTFLFLTCLFISLVTTFINLSFVLAEPFSFDLPSTEEKQSEPAPEKDPLRRENPREAFQSFISITASRQYEKAAEYLQKLPGKSRPQMQELAMQLEALINQEYFKDIKSLSEKEEGDLHDGLDINEESVGKIWIDDQVLDLKLIRVKNQAGQGLWLFSAETLRQLPAFYAKLQPSRLQKIFPDSLVKKSFLSVPFYIWICGIVLVPILFGVSWLLVHLFVLGFRFVKKMLRRPLKPYPFKPMRPVIVILTGFVHFTILSILGLPILARSYYGRVIGGLLWLGLAWLVFYIIDILASRYLRRLLRKGYYNAHTLMVLGSKLLKAAAFVFFALIILKTMGFKITTALAGLGIGGIAFALAAQKTLENLLGGVSLLSDQVIRVGEVCKIGDRVGTVEDIGLRSTQLRTLDRTILYVPNGLLSVEKLENYSRRDKFLFRHTLTLRYETTVEQMRNILKGIQKLLNDHQDIETLSTRVRFVQMAAYSLDIEIFAYLLVDSYESSLELAEELLLQCMQIVEGEGAEFAFPSQTTYIAQDSRQEES